MSSVERRDLAYNNDGMLTILKNIVKDEGNSTDFSTMGYPVLIGSRAAKWHVPSFREPNDWDFVATASQCILFINKFMAKNMKLTYYPGVGLKIIGKCIESNADNKSISFEVEIASDKINLRLLKKDYMNLEDNVDKIEFKEFYNDQERESSKTSAQMILELCCDVKDRMLIPFPCIVAPLKVLEALKTSHIYWADNFYKNIADLHSLRIILDYNNQLISQPLCSPTYDEQTELMLKTRITETEMIRGIPAAHINLNEEFLDRDDDLFVDRIVPHDNIYELVKYGDRPIYEDLKHDKTKAMIEKSLFQKMDYQKQLNCVREEAMVIALERYLIPKISKNQETSYRSALVRICTSLTKGWFRKFAVDNYPRLENLDKDLLSIAHNITKDNPSLQKENKKYELSSELLHEWILDPDIRAIFEPIYACTKRIPSFDDLGIPESSYGVKFERNRTGITITSPVNKNLSITAVATTICMIDYQNCNPGADWWASIAIFPSEDLSSNEYDSDKSGYYYDPLKLHPFDHNVIGYHGTYTHIPRAKRLELTSKHIFTLEIGAKTSGQSWSVAKDIWCSPEIRAQQADDIANRLEIPGFTGDLLFRYVLACLQPTFRYNGNTPLKYKIDQLKANEVIPVKPRQHLWYDAWNYTLNKSNEDSNDTLNESYEDYF
ncbi:hypothetical protein C1645_832612 [Glomus cerebriforme]|uniref:Uncharacterized protein n=1 Tax=Glomus cerebriforme TaxID=658196 RepID=A0A397SJA4_9GLOM|nr:hypothetical protein C1645_832612 [Glomus cerebriforme]